MKRNSLFILFVIFSVLTIQKTLAQGSAAEVIPGGMSSDNKYCQFKVKVNEEKVSQVDVAIKYTDASGKILREANFAWQNIVNGNQSPILKGQTYESKHKAPEAAIKCEVKMSSVSKL